MLNFCPVCGAKVPDANAKFCMSCGKSLAAFAGADNSAPADPVKSNFMNKIVKSFFGGSADKSAAVAALFAACSVNSNTDSTMPKVSSKPEGKKFSEDDSVLKDELQKCREAAEEGYNLALEKYKSIEKTLEEEKARLNQTSSEQNRVSRVHNTELMAEQKQDLQIVAKDLQVIRDNIDQLHKRQKDFSIIVYGRTMAGKSTLMEILTRGNGASIGKGAQRTTRDVREYYWQGLKITDVPGICAFGGKEDEEVALEAAKTADLILFLLTNDAPQADEAKALAELKSFGKPILGLINVKMAFNQARKKISLDKLRKKLADTSEINAIIEQFKAFASKHNQDWSDIQFVPTHLLAAYTAHPAREYDSEIYAASNFAQVEKFILNKIRADGRFIRIKTFVDSVAVPMSNVILKVYEHAGNALIESDIWVEKRVELRKWREEFLQRTQKKLDRLYDELSEKLSDEIYEFAEYHYEDDKDELNKHWEQSIRNLGFEESYRNFLQKLVDECNRKRRELSDELTQQISYSFQRNPQTNFESESTTPWGKYAAIVLPNLLLFVPGVGWGVRIAAGVGSLLFSALFEDKGEKIRKVKENLKEQLIAPSYEILDNMHGKVVEIFNDEILNKGIDEFSNSLAEYQFMLARLGNSQGETAANLCENFSALNKYLLKRAIKYRGSGFIDEIENTARIPGKTFLAFADDADVNVKDISNLLGETLVIMKPQEKLSDNIKIILGCDFDVEEYPLDFRQDDKDAEETISLIPEEEVNETSFKLAQQIARVPIIQKSGSGGSVN